MRAGLSTELVLSAGAELVAESSWDGLSLRAVAGRLSVTPMALYRHVPDSGALADGVLSEIASGLPEASDSGDVAHDLGSWARSALTHLRRYPGVAGHLLVGWFEIEAVLRRIDGLLALMRRHGLEGFEAVAVTNAVFTYVLMRAEAERQVRSAGAVTRRLNLSAEDLPHLASLVEFYEVAEFDAHFEFGLESLLAGMLGRDR
ncbi:MAG: TetR/AcrR family transcriptional regulator C-terminal domain-containing protein [Actinomycetota bacterium]